jgi:hypothetical protein
VRGLGLVLVKAECCRKAQRQIIFMIYRILNIRQVCQNEYLVTRGWTPSNDTL